MANWDQYAWQGITLIQDPVTTQGAYGTACLEGVSTPDSIVWELGTVGDPFGLLPGEHERSDIICWFDKKEYTAYLATPAGLFIKEDAALEHRMVDLGDGYEGVDFIKIVPKQQVVRQLEVTYERFAPTVVASPCTGSRMWMYEQRGWL
jgi:hypothetical protein